MARLLTICHYELVPIRGGGALRSFHLLRQLGREHEVHAIIFQREAELRRETEGYKVPDSVRIYSPIDHPRPASFFDRLPPRWGPGLHYRWLRRSWRGPASGDVLRCHHLIRRILREHQIDAVIFEYIGLLGAASLVQRLSPRTLRILNAHNVDHKLLAQEFSSRERAPRQVDVLRAPEPQGKGGLLTPALSHSEGEREKAANLGKTGECGFLPNAAPWERFMGRGGRELKVVRQTRLIEHNLGRYVHAVWACSEVERNELATPNGIPGYVIPNGVDTAFYSYDDSAQKAAAPYLLFSGWLGTRANEDGVRFLVKEIWPRILSRFPAMRLLIVGGGASAELKQALEGVRQIEVSGPVADVRPYFKRAAVALVPLRIGSGTRLKILEAMSQGNPVVSTRIGAEGLEVADGEHILLADDPEAFTRAIRRLLDEPETFNHIRQGARQLVEAHYDWALIGSRMNAALETLLQNARAGGRPCEKPRCQRFDDRVQLPEIHRD